MLELEQLLDRKPGKLSGGQRQRVAMGRAIVRHPAVFCMDEPLSNLDAKLRVSTRAQIAELQRRLETTTVYVTHDQVEAMTMGDRVAVLDGGRLQQVASPRMLYDDPVNTFVAGFVGSPGMNLIEVPVQDGSAKLGALQVPAPRSSTRDVWCWECDRNRGPRRCVAEGFVDIADGARRGARRGVVRPRGLGRPDRRGGEGRRAVGSAHPHLER